MSRSYKKNSIIQFAPTSKGIYVKWAKRQANKKVRKSECPADGKSYKILYDSYNIHDCKGYVDDVKYLRK